MLFHRQGQETRLHRGSSQCFAWRMRTYTRQQPTTEGAQRMRARTILKGLAAVMAILACTVAVPSAMAQEKKPNILDGMVEHDGHVGQLKKLDELGIADNTIVGGS